MGELRLMNIYDLARELLAMYAESEEAHLHESLMGSAKFDRKMKALEDEVAEYEAEIKRMEAADEVHL